MNRFTKKSNFRSNLIRRQDEAYYPQRLDELDFFDTMCTVGNYRNTGMYQNGSCQTDYPNYEYNVDYDYGGHPQIENDYYNGNYAQNDNHMYGGYHLNGNIGPCGDGCYEIPCEYRIV